MPQIDRDPEMEGPKVSGFSGNGFVVSGSFHERGLVLTPHDAIDWPAPAIAGLDLAALALALGIDPAPEFILLGTGATLRRPAPALVRLLEARDIGLEAMDSRAAARAWGLLRGEGRWISAALYPLDA